MTNPTRAQLIADYTAMITANTPSSGPSSDTQITAIANGSNSIIEGLDPDRPVVIRQVERI